MTDDELETWAERAAIREYDGKMPRALAEKFAWQDVASIHGKRSPAYRTQPGSAHMIGKPQPVAPNAPTQR